MDPLEETFSPPPAYSEQEFEQKTSRATELSLELAKWQTSKLDLDEEGFPRYDPAMFEDGATAQQKGKDQPTPTTFRSQSISKRPLPIPNSASNAGPSTMRHIAPLHISKKSISKVEQAARDSTWSDSASKDAVGEYPPYPARNNPASTSLKPISIPSSNNTLEDDPPYPAIPIQRDNPLFDASNIPVSTHILPSIPSQSVEDTQEAHSAHAANNLLSRQSIQNTKDTDNNPPYAASSLPVQSVTNRSIADTPEDSSYSITNSNPDFLSTADTPDDDLSSTISDLPRPVSNPSLPSILNQRIGDTQEDNPPYEPDYPTEPPYDEQPVENWQADNTTQRVTYVPIQSSYLDRPQSLELELPQHSTQGRQLSTPNTANRMSDSQYASAPNPVLQHGPHHFSLPPERAQHSTQFTSITVPMANRMSDASIASTPNPPVQHEPQHFSLPPAPRNPPRINTSDRPRSQSDTILSAQPSTNVPRVVFNPNIAYGKNPMGGSPPQFRPKVQPQIQAHFNPHMFYNSVVSSQMNTPMTMLDQSSQLPYQIQQPQVRASQTHSSPTNPAANQSHQWRWHSERPSNTYGSVPDTSYGGGGTVSGYPHHYSMMNNSYYNR